MKKVYITISLTYVCISMVYKGAGKFENKNRRKAIIDSDSIEKKEENEGLIFTWAVLFER